MAVETPAHDNGSSQSRTDVSLIWPAIIGLIVVSAGFGALLFDWIVSGIGHSGFGVVSDVTNSIDASCRGNVANPVLERCKGLLSVQAAVESARYARGSLGVYAVAALISALTLAAAIAAAWFARKASYETFRTANAADKALAQTRELTAKQLRAYIMAGRAEVSISREDDLAKIRVTIVYRNNGHTPGYIEHQKHEWHTDQYQQSLASNETRLVSPQSEVKIEQKFSFNAQQLTNISNMWLRTHVFYRDYSGEEHQEQSFWIPTKTLVAPAETEMTYNLLCQNQIDEIVMTLPQKDLGMQVILSSNVPIHGTGP